jgi:hypothetical protein
LIGTVAGSAAWADPQPGSGSWDPLLGLTVSKRLGRKSLDANVLYAFTDFTATATRVCEISLRSWWSLW